MRLSEAQTLARTLMDKHGLSHVPFEWSRAKTILGSCIYRRATKEVLAIKLSMHYTLLLPEAEIREVILHEIAHALTPGHNHDIYWKLEARRLGIQGDRCATPSNIPGGEPWVGTCPKGHTTKMHRAPGRVRSCGKCAPGVFKKENVYEWRKNGRKVTSAQISAKYHAEWEHIFLGKPMVRTTKRRKRY
jgi:hypothetical protein